jgi:hypothetical protein
VNEHGQSVVLAQCLVAGETTYDYQWQLENLLHLWYAPNVNRLSQRAGSPVCEPFV